MVAAKTATKTNRQPTNRPPSRNLPPKTKRSTEAAGTAGSLARPSRERLDDLSREIVRAVSRSRAVILLKDPEVVRQAVAQALTDELTRQEAREETARKRISALKRSPKPHSAEWETLFRRFVDEEYLREGLDS